MRPVKIESPASEQKEFFLSQISIKSGNGSRQYYVFYQKTDRGGVKLRVLLRWGTTIYEEERSDGVLEKHRKQFAVRWHRFLFGDNTSYEYKIYIPQGSIFRDPPLD